MKKGEERMDDRERKPDNRNNKKRNYQLYIILAIVAAVTVALITGLDSLVKKSTTKKVTYDEFVEAVEEGKVDSVKISSARVTFTLTDDLRMTYYTPYLPDSNLLPMLNGRIYTKINSSIAEPELSSVPVYSSICIDLDFDGIFYAPYRRRFRRHDGHWKGEHSN